VLFNQFNQPYDQSKFQSCDQLVSIEDWESQEIHAEGARDKIRLFAPAETNYPFLIPSHLYLYKLSDKKYPNDALAEVIAYRLGVRMGVPVPPAFVACHAKRKTCGVLVEWFYGYATNGYIFYDEANTSGGDILQNIIENYDRKKGRQHNLIDILQLISDMPPPYQSVIYQDIAKMLLFDAIIGNTDRHQDNWEIIETYEVDLDREGDAQSYDLENISLSPAFDNGSSFGHNIFENALIQKMKNIDSFNRKGTHHLKLNRDDNKKILHLDTIKIIHQYLPDCLQHLQSCLNFSISNIRVDLLEIQALEAKLHSGIIWLTDTRINFIVNMLHTRQTYFQSELEKLC
jgi:hypothetical protein